MATGSAAQHDLDDFLGHKTREGSSTAFLDNWKKRGEDPGGKPEVNVVLHTRAPIISVYQHAWPRIITREEQGKDVRRVWSGSFNSWDIEDILKRQYMREDDGTREYPPVECPMGLMLERIDQAIRDGDLDWKEALFKFVGDDPKENKTLHAGAMVNKTKKIWEDLSDKDKRAALKLGVPGPRDAWMANSMAKCLYVFTVVDYDNVGEGIQVAKETTLVGDKTKTAIRDRIESEGDEKGNPLVTPYVIRWRHDKNNKLLQDKYHATVIGQLPITDEIRALIVDKDPPNLDRYVAPGDIEELRASMEDTYCGPEGLLDWDALFGRAEEIAGISREDYTDDPNETPEDVADSIVDVTRRQGVNMLGNDDYIVAKRETIDGEEACFAADGVELFQCEECETTCRDDDQACRNCGADLTEQGDAEDGGKPVNEMDLEECNAALAECDEETDPEYVGELEATIKELTPAPKRRRTRGSGESKGAKSKGAKSKGGKSKGGKAKSGKKGVGF